MVKKIGIFCPGAAGDLLVSTGMLPHKELLWPDSQVVWFAQDLFFDLLKHNQYVTEVRPWEGFDSKIVRSEACASAACMAVASKYKTPRCTDKRLYCRLNQKTKLDYAPTADLDDGYYTPPWLVGASEWGIPYRDVPRTILGANPKWAWHPVLEWTPEEDEAAQDIVGGPSRGWRVMLETNCHSGQTLWNDDTTRMVMERCRAALPGCTFVMASKEAAGKFDAVDLAKLTIRQVVPAYNRCDLFIGCASGISVATCCWRASPKVVRCIFTGNKTFTCNGLAMGPNIESYHAENNLERKLGEALDLAKRMRA